jgi:hypothetical protein
VNLYAHNVNLYAHIVKSDPWLSVLTDGTTCAYVLGYDQDTGNRESSHTDYRNSTASQWCWSQASSSNQKLSDH